jgi:succinate dehydrogenase/fumarate reductase flavoprotein subunit
VARRLACSAVYELEHYGLPFSRDENNKIYQVRSRRRRRQSAR